MLPKKELNTTCLRCKADMPPSERYCSKCGADRELELSIAGDLDPAIASLRRWLAVLGGISLLLTWLLYSDLRRFAHLSSGDAIRALWPGFTLAVGLLVLFPFARRFPLVVSVSAFVLFAIEWSVTIHRLGIHAFEPSPGLAIHAVFCIVLVVAVRSAWRARQLRARAAKDFPSAVAREKTA